ncbi:hypothetical protein [uncultured Tenacibaculum sp.]|uniref:hypothetical protein n=1 Tax=uncultured Tenacibaculum sp. TaxID=174713 RepID=UPI0026266917|nr:hypothetical protein [uncultured Tenacibaculum sp.]
MKKLFIFLFFVANIVTAQNDFEGVLKFKLDFKDKTGEMSEDEVKYFMGTEQTYFLKGKKYRSSFNGAFKMNTYHEGKDTLFTKMAISENLMYSLTNIAEEKILSHKFEKTDVKILNYQCELLIVKTNKGIHKYYYSPELRTKPEYYKNHKSGLWHFFTEKTNGALSIKAISDLDDSYSCIELISVERKSLNDNIFEKPNLPIVKMKL